MIFKKLKNFTSHYFAYLKTQVLLLREWCGGLLCLFTIRKQFENKKNVFLVEFNQWHTEVLPGYCKYFQDLGFNVFVLTRYKGYVDNPFCLFENPPARFYMNLSQMKRLFSSVDFKKIAYTLTTSERIYFQVDGKVSWTLVWDFIGCPPMGKYGCGVIAHGLDDSQHVYQPNNIRNWNFDQVLDKTFVLTPFLLNNKRQMPMLNPFYFGEVKRHRKNKQTLFVVVGTIAKNKRNFSEFLNICEKLTGDWELLVIGTVQEPSLFNSLPSKVKILGRLPFSSMYKVLAQADFFLPLLDPNEELHFRYKNDSTSGSRQLCLGFCVIPVIDRWFGEHYHFSEENALLHNAGELSVAMQRAIDMKDDEYQKMVDSLKQNAEQVYNESMNNLKSQMNFITTEQI